MTTLTMDALGYTIQSDLHLERQGNGLILQSKHNARWSSALVGGFALFALFKLFNVPAQSTVACKLAGTNPS